jgi:IS1 family transposase
MDRKTREIVGVYVGDRSKEAAKELWNSLPSVYRQCAIFYTDFWAAYENVIPKKRHRPVGKESGKTNHIERFNNTMRQRISRLVRWGLSSNGTKTSAKLKNPCRAMYIQGGFSPTWMVWRYHVYTE